MTKMQFDFIFSIGEDCACTAYLRNNKLQFGSLPFDWLTKADFGTRIQLLKSNFAHFLVFEDMQYLPKPATGGVDEAHDYYENTRTGFYFFHDFPAGIPLQESFLHVQGKYQRRIDRLYTKIHEANSILFVWFSRDKYVSTEELLAASKQLHDIFEGKEIGFLIVENNLTLPFGEEQCENVSATIKRYTYNMFSADTSTPLSEVLGNTHAGNTVFKKYYLRKSLYLRIIAECKRILISLIPNKKLRKKRKKQLYDA